MAAIRDTVRNLFATARESCVSREEFTETQQAIVNLIGQMGDTRRRLAAAEAALAEIESERELSETDLSSAATLRAHADRLTDVENQLRRTFDTYGNIAAGTLSHEVMNQIGERVDAVDHEGRIAKLEQWILASGNDDIGSGGLHDRLCAVECFVREAEHQLPLLDERSHQSRIQLIDAKSAIAKLEKRIKELEQQTAEFIKPALSDCGEFDRLMIGRVNRLEDRMDRNAMPPRAYDGPVIAEDDHAYLNKQMRRAIDEFRRRIEAILEGCDPSRVPF